MFDKIATVAVIAMLTVASQFVLVRLNEPNAIWLYCDMMGVCR